MKWEKIFVVVFGLYLVVLTTAQLSPPGDQGGGAVLIENSGTGSVDGIFYSPHYLATHTNPSASVTVTDVCQVEIVNHPVVDVVNFLGKTNEVTDSQRLSNYFNQVGYINGNSEEFYKALLHRSYVTSTNYMMLYHSNLVAGAVFGTNFGDIASDATNVTQSGAYSYDMGSNGVGGDAESGSGTGTAWIVSFGAPGQPYYIHVDANPVHSRYREFFDWWRHLVEYIVFVVYVCAILKVCNDNGIHLTKVQVARSSGQAALGTNASYFGAYASAGMMTAAIAIFPVFLETFNFHLPFGHFFWELFVDPLLPHNSHSAGNIPAGTDTVLVISLERVMWFVHYVLPLTDIMVDVGYYIAFRFFCLKIYYFICVLVRFCIGP